MFTFCPAQTLTFEQKPYLSKQHNNRPSPHPTLAIMALPLLLLLTISSTFALEPPPPLSPVLLI